MACANVEADRLPNVLPPDPPGAPRRKREALQRCAKEAIISVQKQPWIRVAARAGKCLKKLHD